MKIFIMNDPPEDILDNYPFLEILGLIEVVKHSNWKRHVQRHFADF